MRLKILTSALLLFGAALLVAWPWVLGPRPASGAGRQAVAQWGAYALLYFLVTCLTFLSAAFCAALLMRANRLRYLEEMRENLKDLVEGSLNDHGRKQ